MTSKEFFLIIGMMLVTFLPRYIPMLVVGKLPMPDRLFRALRFVPVAVLTAISVPAAVMPQGTVNFGISNAYLYASIAAVLIAWRSQNLLYTIGGGMLVFFLWRVVFV
jgi:branched chain amino acid efflux pump